jgi:hypothetical protein
VFRAAWDQALDDSQPTPLESFHAETAAQAAKQGKAGLAARRPGAYVAYATAGRWPKEQGTVALWYRPGFAVGTNAVRRGLLYATTMTDPANNQFNIRFDTDKPPYNELQAVYQANGDARVVSKRLDWARDAWHHIAVTWDAESLSLYLDGALAGTARQPKDRVEIDGAMTVGTVFGNETNADFDELTIWPQALPAEQIAKLTK